MSAAFVSTSSSTKGLLSPNNNLQQQQRRPTVVIGGGAASLSDYTNFHGMVCSPRTASRCIDSFAGGSILFMPSSYTPETKSTFDCSSAGVLTPLSYYLLVLLSLTGLSTLLGLTDFRIAKEFPTTITTTTTTSKVVGEEAQPPMTSKYNSRLRVEQHILDYCKQHTNAKSIYLKRRFEFYFKLVDVEVVMFHFLCDQNKLHLVEVYHFNNWLIREYIAPFLMKFGIAFRNFVENNNNNNNNNQQEKKSQ